MTANGNNPLRTFLLIFAAIVGVTILCCVCSLVFFWFAGDYFVEFFRSIFP